MPLITAELPIFRVGWSRVLQLGAAGSGTIVTEEYKFCGERPFSFF